jgi:hypothetical protein
MSQTGGAIASLDAIDAIKDAFRAHFCREADQGNPHDLACLRQLATFARRYGRLPDTKSREDLRTLQRIEIDQLDPNPAATHLASHAGKRIDELAVCMKESGIPCAERPLKHRFTPGLYIRELRTPKGVISVSKVHKTEHPFVLLSGKIAVMDGAGGREVIEAPHLGITTPGTRRVIEYLEDSVLLTFHATEHTDLSKIEEEVIEPHLPQLEASE